MPALTGKGLLTMMKQKGAETMRELTEQLLSEMENAVREAGNNMKRAHVGRSDIEQKEGRSNFVTEYDKDNQHRLMTAFARILPEAVFMGEEEDMFRAQMPDGYAFIVDPIDGTTNFLFDLRLSCVSAGLVKNGAAEAGFVYNPYTDEMYRAWRGHGAYRNGVLLRTENRPLEEGLAYYGCVAYNGEHIDTLFLGVREMFETALGIRTLGTGAWALCSVAGGCGVSYTEYRLKPWDYAAALVILEEAGCVITQIDGSPISLLEPSDVLAGTPRAHAQVLDIMARAREKAEGGK